MTLYCACGNPAYLTCGNCDKPICDYHKTIMELENKASGEFCDDCVELMIYKGYVVVLVDEPDIIKIPIESNCMGREKYGSQEMINTYHTEVCPSDAQMALFYLKKNLADSIVSAKITGKINKHPITLKELTEIEYQRKETVYFAQVESLSQVMDILRENPRWLLGITPSHDGKPYVAFFEVDC